jgi:hypothetical protein
MMFDWKQLQPSDGWFARLILNHSLSSLYFGLQVGGKIHQLRTVYDMTSPNALQAGKMKRDLIVLEAMAEYLNAGGHVCELAQLCPQPDEGALWTEGWHYYDGGIDPASGQRVHEFADESCKTFVRWVRNEFIDTPLTLEQIRDDQIGPSSGPAHVDQTDSQSAGQVGVELHGLLGPQAD